MEGLQYIAQNSFRAQRFLAVPGFRHPAYECALFNRETSDASQFVTRALPAGDIANWLRDLVHNEKEGLADAQLKLVYIDRALDVTLGVSRAVFEEILVVMNADPSVLYMIHRDYDGFHEYHGKGYYQTRFVGTPLYALLWTFDPQTCTTRGIFFRRLWNTFDSFGDMLQIYQREICYSQVLSFVSVLFLLNWFDTQTNERELDPIRSIEGATGFGPNKTSSEKPGLKKFDIDELTRWSQTIGEVAGNITNKLRHQRNSQFMLEKIKDDKSGRIAFGNPPPGWCTKYEQSRSSLVDAIPSVEKHMYTYCEYLKYLKDRSERLASVLFALLTHEDAGASITLALESKRDSSSMKTIAVVTMAFLPATFYAAVFAVPSLDWNQNQVVGDKFWIYLAFTIPSTILVFILWLGITQRAWVNEAIAHWKTTFTKRKQ